VVNRNIQTHRGNMLDVARGLLVHGCNARGSMGKGIALAIKERFPAAFDIYRRQHETSGLRLGTITVAHIADGLLIVNAVTQDRWHHPDPSVVLVDYDAVERAFQHVRTTALKEGLGVHFPLIGCGLARGKWSEVAPRIERALGPEVDKHLWLLPDQPEPEWN
jgi:O-acetyl-ADP-ribose deacetylase (regulator of RNase III)